MKFTKSNFKFILLIILITITFQEIYNITLNKKSSKTNNESKNNLDVYIIQMRKYYELAIDTDKHVRNSKRCWDYVWSEGFYTKPEIKSAIKETRQNKINPFLERPTSVSIDISKDLEKLAKAIGDNISIGIDTNINCKEYIMDIINYHMSNKLSTSYYFDKINAIFEYKKESNLGQKLFVTSAASVHRSSSLRNPDLFEILNVH